MLPKVPLQAPSNRPSWHWYAVANPEHLLQCGVQLSSRSGGHIETQGRKMNRPPRFIKVLDIRPLSLVLKTSENKVHQATEKKKETNAGIPIYGRILMVPPPVNSFNLSPPTAGPLAKSPTPTRRCHTCSCRCRQRPPPAPGPRSFPLQRWRIVPPPRVHCAPWSWRPCSWRRRVSHRRWRSRHQDTPRSGPRRKWQASAAHRKPANKWDSASTWVRRSKFYQAFEHYTYIYMCVCVYVYMWPIKPMVSLQAANYVYIYIYIIIYQWMSIYKCPFSPSISPSPPGRFTTAATGLLPTVGDIIRLRLSHL